MSDSDSPLSSIVSTDDEKIAESINRGVGLERYFKKAKPASPPSPKRPPSPPHDYVLADNPDIAVRIHFYFCSMPAIYVVMFALFGAFRGVATRFLRYWNALAKFPVSGAFLGHCDVQIEIRRCLSKVPSELRSAGYRARSYRDRTGRSH